VHPHSSYKYKYKYKYHSIPTAHPIALPSLFSHSPREQQPALPGDKIGVYDFVKMIYELNDISGKVCGNDVSPSSDNHQGIDPLSRSNHNKNLTITFDHVYAGGMYTERYFYELFRGEDHPIIRLTVDEFPYKMYYSKVPTEKYPTVKTFISFAHWIADQCEDLKQKRHYGDVFDAIAGLIAEKWFKEPVG
jgi:hypothetical protein